MTQQQLDDFDKELQTLLDKHGFLACLYSLSARFSPTQCGWTSFSALYRDADALRATAVFLGNKLTAYMLSLEAEVANEARAAQRSN